MSERLDLPPETTKGPVRVLTVNIHKGWTAFNRRFVLHELREAVRMVASDLVFLQEVGGEEASLEATHCEFLADQIWLDHAYGRNAVADGLDHGNAVLSRWPIARWTNHDVSLPGHEPRGVLHCVVALTAHEQPLHAVCVHLGLRERQREHQLDRLMALLDAEVPPDAPLVVAGDFNDWRSRADRRLRKSGLVEVFARGGGRHARSFPAAWPLLRLDRIYVRRVQSALPLPLPRRPWSALSDHAPLAAEIVL
ncbi:MAG: endonuclease/exonuclease/phosphatase family protein [Rubrivivax sp.]